MKSSKTESITELRLSEARLSAIISISADAIISIDDSQRITMFNEGAEKIFGYSKTEAIGAPFEMLIPERYRKRHRQHVARFAEGPETARRMGERSAAIFALRKNGEEFPADAAISRIEVGGKCVLTVSLRDVTEQASRESDQEFLAGVGSVLASTLDYEQTLKSIAQLAVRHLADFCVVDVIDEHGDIRRLNVASRDPSRAWICDLLMQTPLDRSRPHLVASALATKRPLLLQRPSPDQSDAFAQSENHRRALLAIDPTAIITVPLLAHGKLLGAIALLSSDASRVYGESDVRLAEELAVRAALSIEHAQLYRAAQRAIAARDQVLGIVAHDLRNPLNVILLRATQLHSMTIDENESVRVGKAIERDATRMNRLIEDLLDVSSMEAGHLRMEQTRVPTRQIIVDTFEVQHSLASSAGLELSLDVDGDLPDVWADSTRVVQVLENLIGNAIKFSRSGGRIVVGAVPRDHEVVFSVTDTGVGIAPADQLHLFDRFWQARSDRRGVGLGLPIVRAIVEAHGGRIWVDSTPGSGSTFYFTIPAAPRKESTRETSTSVA